MFKDSWRVMVNVPRYGGFKHHLHRWTLSGSGKMTASWINVEETQWMNLAATCRYIYIYNIFIFGVLPLDVGMKRQVGLQSTTVFRYLVDAGKSRRERDQKQWIWPNDRWENSRTGTQPITVKTSRPRRLRGVRCPTNLPVSWNVASWKFSTN